MANIERGFIVGFKCCAEGRMLTMNPDGTYTNSDGILMGRKSWRPFLIISHTTKNNGNFTKYISAIPITTSSSKFNQERGIKLTKDILSQGGESLLYEGSIIKIDSIVSVFKDNYEEDRHVLGEINPSTKPYKQILSQVIKNFGCNELI